MDNKAKIICSDCGGELKPVLTISGDVRAYQCKKCKKYAEFIGKLKVNYGR